MFITSEREARSEVFSSDIGKKLFWAARPVATLLKGLYLEDRMSDWQAVFLAE